MDSSIISSIDGSTEEGHYAFQSQDGVGNIHSLLEMIFVILQRANQKFALCETFTGGMISDLLVNHAGVSRIYSGGIVAYSPEAKLALLGIPEVYLNNFGEVSREITLAMAESCRHLFGSDYAIAMTGIAGPYNGSPTTPIGSCWLAIEGPERQIIQKLDLAFGSSNRNLIRERATYAALKIFLQILFEDGNR